MPGKTARIGVALCSCGGQLRPLFAQADWGKRPLGPGIRVLRADNLCLPAEQAALARSVKSAGLERLVLAGCPSSSRDGLRRALARLARLAGLPASAVSLAPRPPRSPRPTGRRRGRDASLQPLLREIRRAVAIAALMPSFPTRRLPLTRSAVVIGAGPAGLHAAAALRELGLPVTVVERQADTAAETLATPRDVEVLTDARVAALEGRVGAFTLQLATPAGPRRLEAGAVVVAAGVPAPDRREAPYAIPGVVPLEELLAAAAALPRLREGRDLAIVLDYALEEGKASSEWALRLALELQGQEGTQVHLLCRDLRVAALPLEGLYDRVREAGVDIVKHDGSVELRPAQAPAAGEAASGLEIRYTDSLLGARALLRCALAGVSRYGVRAAADADLAAALGLSTDGLGQLQENNLHLAPEATNRPGLFVVGSCRGQHYLPQVQAEARAAALAVHRLLSPGFLPVELSSPTVDPDKCALCLTCVRACPYKAMVVDAQNEAAKSLPEACQRCGICVGECPARAIQLPAWSDAVLFAQLADGRP